MRSLRVDISTAKCRSFGKCIAVAPETFGFDAARKATIIGRPLPPDDVLLKAAKSCPYRAIAVLDEATGEQVFPPIRK